MNRVINKVVRMAVDSNRFLERRGNETCEHRLDPFSPVSSIIPWLNFLRFSHRRGEGTVADVPDSVQTEYKADVAAVQEET